MNRGLIAVSTLFAISCGSSDVSSPSTPSPAPTSDDPSSPPTTNDAPPAAPSSTASAATTPPDPTMRVKFLGVGGFMLEYGGDSVLTAPLYTRPSMFEVTAGFVDADPKAVDSHLTAAQLANVRAVLAGHAHYDHLLDAPTVLDRAPGATLYANRSARNLLAAYAPDRAAKCTGKAAPSISIARTRVVALDDPAASVVDYRACPDQKPEGAPLEGKWVSVPSSHVRIMAICSKHPAQVGPYHYGEGNVDEEQCSPPQRMDAWKEGATLSYLVDFLDAKTNEPSYRVYYQDAPTDLPTGLPPAPVLAGKRIDLALLCLGSSDSTEDAPAPTVGFLAPRFVIGGHWEDFFRGADDTPEPIAFLDVGAWAMRARDAIKLGPPETKDLVRNAKATLGVRALVADPNDTFEIPK